MDFEDIWLIFLRFCMVVCFVILIFLFIKYSKQNPIISDRQDRLEKRIDNLEQSLRTKDKEIESYLIKEKQK